MPPGDPPDVPDLLRESLEAVARWQERLPTRGPMSGRRPWLRRGDTVCSYSPHLRDIGAKGLKPFVVGGSNMDWFVDRHTRHLGAVLIIADRMIALDLVMVDDLRGTAEEEECAQQP